MTRLPAAIGTLLLLAGASLAIRHGAGPARPLAGRVVCIDPGHGGTAATDSYRVGPGGEREEWIDLRVARLLQGRARRSAARAS